MNRKVLSGFFALLILLQLSGTAKAHVALDYPVGGEVFVSGNTVTIEWRVVVPHEQNNWDLYFSPDGGGTWEELQLDLPVSRTSYRWIIPDLTTDSGRVRIVMDNVGGNYTGISGNFSIRTAIIGVQEELEIPEEFRLQQAYPNPFNPSTTIEYRLPKKSYVSLLIYDIRGAEVERLVEEEQSAGSYTVRWNASSMPGGLYFYRLTAGDFIQTKKMLLIK